MTDEFQQVLGLAQAHSLAISMIPGLRIAVVRVYPDAEMFSVDLNTCVGSCAKCDSFFRTFRQEPSTILEVIRVGYAESTAPPESESFPDAS